MEKVTTVTGIAVPLERTNVDTDQIIPAVFLKRVTKSGYDDALFFEWRKDPDFVINRPEFAGGKVLVAGSDFGIGSSREHAVWALNDYGFRAVLSPKFSDIFRGNAGKQGLLAAQITEEAVEQIWAVIREQPGIEIAVNLVDQTVSIAELTVPFEIDAYTKWRLLEGLDDIGLTLRDEARITEFESSRESWRPRTLPPRHPTEVTT